MRRGWLFVVLRGVEAYSRLIGYLFNGAAGGTDIVGPLPGHFFNGIRGMR